MCTIHLLYGMFRPGKAPGIHSNRTLPRGHGTRNVQDTVSSQIPADNTADDQRLGSGTLSQRRSSYRMALE